MERANEVVERLLSAGLRPDQDVGVEPHEGALGVEVDAAPPRRPLGPPVVKKLRGDGGVGERAPGPAGLAIHLRSEEREGLPLELRRAQAAARAEDFAVVLRQALVRPEELAVDRRLVVVRDARHEALGRTVLAVPGMHVLVGQESSEVAPRRFVEQRALGGAVVARLVVLEARRGKEVGKREQQVVAPIVARAEKGLGLGHEPPVARDVLGADLDRRGAVAGDVEEVRDPVSRREIDRAEEAPGQDRRVDERHERGGREGHGLAGDALDGKRRAELPSGGQGQRRPEDRLVRARAARIEQHGPPVDVGHARRRRGVRRQRPDVIEGDLERRGARRHDDLEVPHLLRRALPGGRPARGGDGEPCQVRDRSLRPVLSRNPLRVSQRQRPRRHGDRLADPEDPPRRTARVDRQRDRLRRPGRRHQHQRQSQGQP